MRNPIGRPDEGDIFAQATIEQRRDLLLMELRGAEVVLSDDDLADVDWFARNLPPDAIERIVAWIGRVASPKPN